jgi:hypothetical protein
LRVSTLRAETAAVSAVAEVEPPQPGGAGCGTLPVYGVAGHYVKAVFAKRTGKLASMILDRF